MIAIDTNVLVRYVVDDDQAQAAAATRLIEGAGARGEPVYLSLVVLCESAWVWQRSYRLGKPDLLAVFNRILASASDVTTIANPALFSIEEVALVRSTLDAYSAGRGDFADHLIGSLAQAAGAATTYTFDRTAAKSPRLTLLRTG